MEAGFRLPIIVWSCKQQDANRLCPKISSIAILQLHCVFNYQHAYPIIGGRVCPVLTVTRTERQPQIGFIVTLTDPPPPNPLTMDAHYLLETSATSTQITVAANFQCHPKTSVTQFPLPLEIEWRVIWDDICNPVWLKQTMVKDNCGSTHNLHLKMKCSRILVT